MKIKFTWFVPDTLTIKDPSKQGPTVAEDRDGLKNVVVGVHWAVKGEAFNDDDTPVTGDGGNAVSDFIAHFTRFGEPDLHDFEDVTKFDRQELLDWLSGMLFKRINKADQEDQLRKRMLDNLSPAGVMAMPRE